MKCLTLVANINKINYIKMNELINLMYYIKELSLICNEIPLIELQPKLLNIYDKLEAEQLILNGVSRSLPNDDDEIFSCRMAYEKIEGEKHEWKKYYSKWLNDNYLK